MRIRVVIPVPDDTFNDYVMRECGSFKAPDALVEVTTIAQGPPDLHGHYDEHIAAVGVVEEAVRAEGEGCDGVFVDCFGEPGVAPAREVVRIPVVGAFAPSAYLASLLTDRWSVVTILPSGIPSVRAMAREASVESRMVSVRSINISALDLHSTDVVRSALLAQMTAAVDEDGAEAVVLGCTGFDMDLKEDLEQLLAAEGRPIPIVNAHAAGLGCVELMIRNRVSHSAMTYRTPPARPRYLTAGTC